MTGGDMIVLAVLGVMVATIIAAMIHDKKNGKSCGGCSGCANYGTCRAHLGCSNNTSRQKQ